MAKKKETPLGNQLLSMLPNRERKQTIAQCESVELEYAQILCLPGKRIRYVYFPTGSAIALVAPLDGHARLEVGMIGSEGMFGSALMLGANVPPTYAMVQGAGKALRMSASQFRLALENSPILREKLNIYLYALISQLVQTAICTHFHVVEERLARWLLMSHDRAHSDSLYLTQEFLSHMLGSRRVGVSIAASGLRKRKVISYSRGLIKILDRSALEAASCTCYGSDVKTYNRVLA